MYYSRPEVTEELTKFLKGRKVFVREGGGVREVSFGELQSLSDAAEVYGSAEVFEVGSATPSITILFNDDVLRLAVGAAKLIINYLGKYGVSKSVYVVWARKYIEVRIHEGAIPRTFVSEVGDLQGTALLIAEAVINDLRHRLFKLVSMSSGSLVVGNTLAVNQYLIAPLSRTAGGKDVVAYLKPSDLDELPDKVVNNIPVQHRREWSDFSPNELSELATKVLRIIREGTLSKDKLTVLKVSRKSGKPAVPKLVGRFEVMALLQAARYYLLTGDLEKAKSFGLNRAIFYAWAKHYGRVIKPWRASSGTQAEGKGKGSVKLVKVLGEDVPTSGRGWFVIGDQEQLPQDFDAQVANKINAALPFDVVWEVALQYVRKFPESVLRNQQRFFKYVYEPVRDGFIEKVVLAKDLDSLVARSLGYLMQHRREKPRSKSSWDVKPLTKPLTAFMKKEEKRGEENRK